MVVSDPANDIHYYTTNNINPGSLLSYWHVICEDWTPPENPKWPVHPHWATCVFVPRGPIVPQTSRFPSNCTIVNTVNTVDTVSTVNTLVLFEEQKLYFSSAPYLDFLAPVPIAQIFCSLSQQFAVFRFSNLTVSVENLCYDLDLKAQKKKRAAVLPSWPIYTSRSDFLLLRMCSQAAQVCIGLLPISPTVLTNWLLPPHVVVRHGNLIFKHLAISSLKKTCLSNGVGWGQRRTER